MPSYPTFPQGLKENNFSSFTKIQEIYKKEKVKKEKFKKRIVNHFGLLLLLLEGENKVRDLKTLAKASSGTDRAAKLSHLVKFSGSCGCSGVTSFQNYEIEMKLLLRSLDNRTWIIRLLILFC